MVSTRQMLTSCNGSNVAGSSTTNSILNNSSSDDSNSLRPSVVTRQSNSSSAVNSVSPCSSSTAEPTITTMGAFLSAASTSLVRQTQAFKTQGTIANSLATTSNREQMPSINLLDLPEEILSHILSYIGYKKVGQLRVVSKKCTYFIQFLANTKPFNVNFFF